MTSVSSPSASEAALRNFLSSMPDSSVRKMITCPLSSKPLTAAVALQPCNHHVNEFVTKQIFTPTISGAPNPNYNICPSCKETVTSSNSDLKMRLFATWILKHRLNSSPREMEERKKEVNTTKSAPSI